MSGSALLTALVAAVRGVAVAVGPLAALFVVLQLAFLKLPRREMRRIAVGTVIASAGLLLFLLGVGMAFLPFGQAVGEALGAMQPQWLLVPFGAVLGFVTTWGEPSVRILANEVEEASAGSIPRTMVLYTICGGVAVAVAVGLLRIAFEIPLVYLVAPGYALVLVIMWFSDQGFVGIAIDAGGVATGPLANSFLLALAFGVAAGLDRHDPLVSGLGLVALIALAPVISLMLLGLVLRWKERPKES